MIRAFLASTIALCLFAFVACTAEDANNLRGRSGGGSDDPNASSGGPAGSTPAGPGACEAKPHVGFANTDFVADRKPGDIGTNRRRVKPYSVLGTEFKRALGVVPANLATNVAAFGEAPPRWFIEPNEGAVSLYTMYSLSFTSCYDTMTAATYTAVPTPATATTECAAMQRKFWQRTATPEETQACVDLIMGDATETNPRRRWAHGCASILSSTGFTTY